MNSRGFVRQGCVLAGYRYGLFAVELKRRAQKKPEHEAPAFKDLGEGSDRLEQLATQ